MIITVLENRNALQQRAAEHIRNTIRNTLKTGGICRIALSGGSTPEGIFQILGRQLSLSSDEASRLHIFWVDERCVAPTHEDSNYRLAWENWLKRMPGVTTHRMKGEEEPFFAAEDYEREIRESFALAENEMPRFDLILLGVGEDGHIASLFPEAPALEETKRICVTYFVPQLKAFRLTLTLPVINAATEILGIASGANKRPIIQHLQQEGRAHRFPVDRIPARSEYVWLVDKAASL